MGAVSFEEEISTKVAPTRLFRAVVTDNHNLVPKIAPNVVKSGAIIQGDGGAGSIKELVFQDDAPFPFLKYRIDELDESNFTYNYTLIEGGGLGDTIKSIYSESKLVPTADGGCISKIKRVFTLEQGAELDPKEQKDMHARMLSMVLRLISWQTPMFTPK